eukprot:gene37987-62810_t
MAPTKLFGSWRCDRAHTAGTDFGLCGQFLGKSKFVSAADSFPATKGQALDALGLRGYDAFDKPGTLHVVRAELPAELMKEARPLIPVLYQVGRAAEGASEPERWEPELNFQDGTVPGYTSGLKCELVIRTFKVTAASIDDLRSEGVQCVALGD